MIGRNFGNPIATCAGPQASCEERAKRQEVSMATVWWSSARQGSKTIERKNLQCNLLVWCGCRPKNFRRCVHSRQAVTHPSQPEGKGSGRNQGAVTHRLEWRFPAALCPPGGPCRSVWAGGAVLNGLNVAEIAKLSGDPSGVAASMLCGTFGSPRRTFRSTTAKRGSSRHVKSHANLVCPCAFAACSQPSLGSEG